MICFLGGGEGGILKDMERGRRRREGEYRQ